MAFKSRRKIHKKAIKFAKIRKKIIKSQGFAKIKNSQKFARICKKIHKIYANFAKNSQKRTKMNSLQSDLGKLILRASIGAMMLLHGISKMQNFDGSIGFIGGVLGGLGLPAFIAYGVILGEVVAPVLLILGALPRLSALAIIVTMVFAILSHLGGESGQALFSLSGYGGWAFELQGLYLFGALSIVVMGAGRLSLFNRF